MPAIITKILPLQKFLNRTVVITLDGGSGAGKSLLLTKFVQNFLMRQLSRWMIFFLLKFRMGRIFCYTPEVKRHNTLSLRDGDEFSGSWRKRWNEEERFYFEKIRPKSSFDLIIKA